LSFSKFCLMAASAAAAVGVLVSPLPAAAAAPIEMARIPSDLPAGIRVGLTRPVKTLVRAYRSVAQEGKEEKLTALYSSDGRPFFTADSGCDDACLKNWQPAVAPAGAKETGGFTILGGHWAFRGKPLYVAVNGPKISDPFPFTAGSERLGEQYLNGLAVVDGADGMHLVRLVPQSWMDLPYSIGVAEYRLAPGQVLAAGAGPLNAMGKPLYMFRGTPEQEKALPAMFVPQPAAVMSMPLGDFTIAARDDGSRQWAYKGAALYTCACDTTVGALNGEGVVAGIAPAVIFAYSTPKDVVLKKDSLALGRLADAHTGKTLYFRDRMLDDYQPDRARNMNGTINAQIAAAMSTMHCDAVCEKEWKPFLAPKDAQVSGYWSVIDRPDGKHQWAYKNAALYTHVKEAPGSLDGNETYKIEFDDGHGGKAMPNAFGMGLIWRAAVP
jgi:predicted lipoprotein with Yx(FWY)xxD motif